MDGHLGVMKKQREARANATVLCENILVILSILVIYGNYENYSTISVIVIIDGILIDKNFNNEKCQS